jgi:ABC-type Fe3+/spermidine/putrescine transport system ATPase subunit
MSYLEFSAISKHFDNSVAVEDLNLKVEQGEFFSLLGPSGCGKSTTLRMLAGFVKPTTGAIYVNGRDVTALPPEARDIGMVFQNYAIFPHMTVFDNIAFGLVERKMPKA